MHTILLQPMSNIYRWWEPMADAPEERRAASLREGLFGDVEVDPDYLPRPGESIDDFYARSSPRWEATRKGLDALSATRAAYVSGALPERRGKIGRKERRARALYSGDTMDLVRAYLEGIPGVWGLTEIVLGIIALGLLLSGLIAGIFVFAWVVVAVENALAVPTMVSLIMVTVGFGLFFGVWGVIRNARARPPGVHPRAPQ